MNRWMTEQERDDIERELYDSVIDEAGAMFVASLALVSAIFGFLAVIWYLNS